MGFLDNFKEAMKRGSEAANNYIERERAKEAAAAAPARAGGPSARAASSHSSRSALPEGVISIKLTHDEIIECTKSDGTPFKVSAFAEVRAKAIDPSQFEGKDQKAVAREIIINTLKESLAGREEELHNVKSLMTIPRHISETVVSALNGAGFEAMFKMPLMLKPQDDQPITTT